MVRKCRSTTNALRKKRRAKTIAIVHQSLGNRIAKATAKRLPKKSLQNPKRTIRDWLYTRWFNAKFRPLLPAGTPPEWLLSHPRRKYIYAIVLGTPPWISREDLEPFYTRAAILTESTGWKHTVDHIIPLNHPLVCGLNVPWNLQVLTWEQNQAKGNKFCPDQLELL